MASIDPRFRKAVENGRPGEVYGPAGSPCFEVAAVARMFEVDPHTIRNWVQEGNLDAEDAPSGRPRRFITSASIERRQREIHAEAPPGADELWQELLVRQGHDLDEARSTIRALRDERDSLDTQVSELRQALADVTADRDDLAQAHTLLARTLERMTMRTK